MAADDVDSEEGLEPSDEEEELETDSDDDDGTSGKIKNQRVASAPSSPHKMQHKMQQDLFKSISKLKVFSYLSDDAFMLCLSLMEYIDLPEIGMELFSEDKPFEGSLYVVIEGGVNLSCGLPHAHSERPISFSAGPGDFVTSLLSMLSGLVEQYQNVIDKRLIDIHTVDVKATASESNTRLIRIPPSAFVAILDQYPHDVHQIAQSVLSRSQRVTIQTLVKSLGLGFEVLYNHGNKIPIKCDSRNILSMPEEEEIESLAKQIMEDCNMTFTEERACTIDVRDEILESIARIVSHSLGSTAASAVKTIQTEASIWLVKPGEVIVPAQTNADCIYFVIDGAIDVGTVLEPEKGIRSTSYREERNGDPFHVLYQALPGDIVGQMSCFTDEVSFASLRSSTSRESSTLLLKLPKRTFCSLCDNHSGVLIQCINQILSVDFSPLVHLFDWGVEWMHVQAGTLVASRGEICDRLHVVLSGRLKAAPRVRNYKGVAKNEDEYGRGACIGEAHVIVGEEFPNDVYAIRNSELAVLPVNVLEYIMHMFPQTAVHYAKEIATRQVQNKRHKATRAFSGLPHLELSVATLAVVPLCFDSAKDAYDLCENITGALSKIAPCALMTKSIARQSVGSTVFNLRNAVHEVKMSRLLGDLEESHRLTVYQTDSKFTSWTKLCIQQADCVLLVVKAEKAPSCYQLERYLAWAFEKLLVRQVQVLVLQEVNAGDGTSETRVPLSREVSEWIENSDFIEGQHLVRLPIKVHDKDVARMCRRITGRSLGLALGGGGARGLAHIGVIKALMERGVLIDICGGTSQGAFIGGKCTFINALPP